MACASTCERRVNTLADGRVGGVGGALDDECDFSSLIEAFLVESEKKLTGKYAGMEGRVTQAGCHERAILAWVSKFIRTWIHFLDRFFDRFRV